MEQSDEETQPRIANTKATDDAEDMEQSDEDDHDGDAGQ